MEFKKESTRAYCAYRNARASERERARARAREREREREEWRVCTHTHLSCFIRECVHITEREREREQERESERESSRECVHTFSLALVERVYKFSLALSLSMGWLQ